MKPIIFEELKVDDEVVTRDGRKGRVICTDRKHYCELPIACLISDCEEGEKFTSHRSDGRSCTDDRDFDIFLPPKKEYVNLYRKNNGEFEVSLHSYSTDTRARHNASSLGSYIKTIEVEV